MAQPKYSFVSELNHWVRWEQDKNDPFSFEAIKLSAAEVAELGLEHMEAPTTSDGAEGVEGVEGCTDEELVSSRAICAAVGAVAVFSPVVWVVWAVHINAILGISMTQRLTGYLLRPPAAPITTPSHPKQVEIAEVLHLSQQQDSGNAEVANLAREVRNTQRRRSSRLANSSMGAAPRSPPPPDPRQQQPKQPPLRAEPSSSNTSSIQPAAAPAPNPGSRWETAREVKLTVNANTAKADKKAMKAFQEFLLNRHQLTEEPSTIEQGKLRTLLADFISRVRRALSTSSVHVMQDNKKSAQPMQNACRMLFQCLSCSCQHTHACFACRICTVRASCSAQHYPCKAIAGCISAL